MKNAHLKAAKLLKQIAKATYLKNKAKASKQPNKLFLDNVSPSTIKPTMEKYGWQSANSFEEESGWMYEGGEDAYYEALKVWEKENGY